jgi:MFS family permease
VLKILSAPFKSIFTLSISKAGMVYILITSLYTLMDKTIGSNLVIYLTNFHKLSSVLASSIFAISCLTIAFVDFPLGNIADKYGRKKIFILGLFCWSVGVLIYGLSSTLGGLISGVVIQGLGISLISGVPSSWYYDNVEKTQNSGETVHVFAIQKALGNLLILLTGPVVAFALSYSDRATFIISSIIGLIAIVVSIIFMEENRGINYKKDEPLLLLLKKNIFQLKANKNFKLYLIGDLFENIFFFGFIFNWQQAFIDSGLNKYYIGITYCFMIFSMGLGSSFLAYKTKNNKISYKTYYVFGTLLCISILLLGTYHISNLMFIGGLIIFEFSLGVLFPLNSQIMNKIVSGESRTALLSAISSSSGFQAAGIYMLHGLISELWGAQQSFLISAVAALIALLIKGSIAKKTFD